MATDSDRNNLSVQGKGNPSDAGKQKSEVKKAGDHFGADPSERDRIQDEYTEGVDQPRSDLQNNPNRNPHKVNNQRVPYGGNS